MLKNMKAKALALLTALAMMLGLGAVAIAPAYAAGNTGTLTVTSSNPEANTKTVSAWRMFDITVSGSGGTASYGYTLRSEWRGFFENNGIVLSGDTDAAASKKAYDYVKNLADEENEVEDSDTYNAGAVADFAKKAADWAEKNTVATDSTASFSDVNSDGTYEATFSNVPFGYYVVRPASGSTDVSTPIRGTDAMLVPVVSNEPTTVVMKSEYPTVEKKVNNENHASASVGDTLNFTLTSTVPDTSEYTDSYKFAFVDTLSKGLTFNGNTKITIGEDTTLTEGTDYKLTKTVDDGTGETTLRIDFGTESGGIYNAKKLFEGKVGKTITVTYTATLNENAEIKVDQTNTVKVVYSNNPTTDGTGESGESKTHQYTFGFDLNKTDGTNGLAGAKFKLQDSNGDDITLVSAGVDTYRPAKADEMDDDSATTEVTTPKGGVIHFTGLAAGTYTLVETEAPEGYNKAADTTVTIEATYHEDGTLDTWTVNNNGQNAVVVVNRAGALLPGTGGIGTVIFTVAGLVLIVAGVAWAMRRRQRD